MSISSSGPEAGGTFDPDEDRYPTVKDAVSLILDAVESPDLPVERVEMNCLANGDVTYRYWEPRAEEPIGGAITVD